MKNRIPGKSGVRLIFPKSNSCLRFCFEKTLQKTKLLVIRKPGGGSQLGSSEAEKDPGELIRNKSLVGGSSASQGWEEEVEKTWLSQNQAKVTFWKS